MVRSDSHPGSGLLTAGLGSAESDCTATSPEGSAGEGLPVGCNAVSSSRLRAARCADRANPEPSAGEGRSGWRPPPVGTAASDLPTRHILAASTDPPRERGQLIARRDELEMQ